ncbi:MAG: F0F1 ATP synthase subunit B [Gammaproteobacteria bacterium]|jgi:F-type H+-transporting ATPase subunit b|nr:F0F1 ATP synthase subunit B [Gammaproteobacteria bacterium]
MALDWFTLGAQVVNFLVLVALLRHLFYARLIGAMNAREAHIAGRLEEAARERAAAKQEAEAFRSRNREFDRQRAQMLAQASDEADSHREQMMEQARLEAERAQAQWLEALERERVALLQDIRERLGQGVFTLASRSLRELADAELEEQILKVFIERIRILEPAEREAILTAARGMSPQVEVCTAFPVGEEARKDLTASLRHHLDDSLEVRFTTVPELICGIELRAHSHRLAWNLDSYLESLEARVFEALEESAGSHAELR